MGIFGVFSKKSNSNYVKKAHFFGWYNKIQELISHFHDEMQHNQKWIMHLHSRTEDLENRHMTQIEQSRKDMKNIQQWVKYLHQNSEKLSKELKESTDKLSELYNKHSETMKTLNDIQKENKELRNELTKKGLSSVSQVVTSDTRRVTDSVTVTSDDMSPTRNKGTTTKNYHKIGDTRVSQAVSQSVTNDKDDMSSVSQSVTRLGIARVLRFLNDSESRVLYLLSNLEKPLSYQNIADKADMNYSTVKNIVYRLRKRGLDVKSKVNRRGEKEFFLGETIKTVLKSHF